MAEDGDNGDFKVLDPDAKTKLINERIKQKVEAGGEGRPGLLGFLLSKFEVFRNFIKLDFLKKKKTGEEHLVDTDAYQTIQGEAIMGRPEVDDVLNSSVQSKLGSSTKAA